MHRPPTERRCSIKLLVPKFFIAHSFVWVRGEFFALLCVIISHYNSNGK